MAFIETIPVRKADEPTRNMYERQQSAYGYVPNYAKVFCSEASSGTWIDVHSNSSRSPRP